jgi:hypothetical protein
MKEKNYNTIAIVAVIAWFVSISIIAAIFA